MSELKTHAEIIAEMRGADNKCQLATKDGTGCYHCPFGSAASNCVFDNYADRIEAAWEREAKAIATKAQSVTDCNQLGNTAKMRDALENIVHHFCSNCPNNGPDGCELSEAEGRFEFLCHKLQKARAALAEPIRNCDVGTAKEQSDRFAKFCRLHEKGCGLGWGSKGIGHPKVTCPAYHNAECGLEWAQMPYEEEVK